MHKFNFPILSIINSKLIVFTDGFGDFVEKLPMYLKYLIVSFTSDWLFPTIESKMIVNQLNSLSREVSFLEIDTDKGHDSFLLEEPQLDDVIKGFLTNNFAKIDE